MKLIQPVLCVSLLVLSNLASAAVTINGDGFLDSTTNLEWLTPSKIASPSDYNAYVSSGWHVATSNELSTLLTSSYLPFDAALFDSFAALAMPQDSTCAQSNVLYCSYGWYENVSTVDGTSYGYEYGWIGLSARSTVFPSLTITDTAYVSSWRDDPELVSAWGLETGSFTLNSTIGSYSLYGEGNSYSTFMVRAVPLPNTALIFISALGTLMTRKLKRRSTKTA